jgi:hypothetical protein
VKRVSGCIETGVATGSTADDSSFVCTNSWRLDRFDAPFRVPALGRSLS